MPEGGGAGFESVDRVDVMSIVRVQRAGGQARAGDGRMYKERHSAGPGSHALKDPREGVRPRSREGCIGKCEFVDLACLLLDS